jgi:CubicO group peptidase (beta-lactamase class C family)
MRLKSLFGILAATAGLAAPVFTQSAPTDSAVLAIIKERVDAGKFAGLAVGLVSPTGVRRVIAYGPNAGVTPFDGNSIFEIGSITKTFTAAILADMVKKGEVKLDDPVEKFLPPGTKVPARDGKKITLLDLAVQNSGLPRMPGNFAPKDPDNPYADYSVQQMYDFLATYTLPRAIGEKYEYSNLAVGLLGHALALKAGKSWEALVIERVLNPLRMNDTRITLTPALQRRLAPGHNADGAVVKNWDLPTLAGAGALRSSVNDMLTYIRANADSASSPIGATLAMTNSARAPTTSPTTMIGLLWNRTRTPAGNTIVWHNGGTAGYRTFVGYNEATRAGVVVLPNTSTSPDDIGFHLLDPSVPLTPAPKARTAVTLTTAQLDAYVGTYEAATPALRFTVTRVGAALVVELSNQPRFQLHAESDGEFFVRAVDAQISFTRNAAGAVSGLVLHQNGQNLVAARK